MDENRRTFIKAAGVGAAGTFLNLNPRAIGANDRINLALIGAHNQGRGVAARTIKAGGFIKTLCDLDPAVIAKIGPEIAKAQGKDPAPADDYRRVLEDKDIDAVIISTPDHWHTIMGIEACQAGKDVYIEKPLSQTIQEGHLLRQAARKYNRVMQVGTQRRSMAHFAEATDYVASGKLGKVCMIKAWMCQVRESIGRPADSTPPAGVDYDRWLGPAPKRPFNTNRFHYTWRFFWDYGNSELGNQGVHMLDVAIWAIQKMRGVENCLPTRVSGTSNICWLDDAKEVPDTQVLTYDYGNLLLTWELRSFAKQDPIEGTAAGTGYYGTEGTLIVDGQGWKVYSKDGKPGPSGKYSGGSHEQNFLECMKSRKRPNSDVEIGRLSTTLCHLGNICTHLKRDVRFDPKTETFGNDREANTYLTKQYRKPYLPPKV
ncbi:MAG TPA: Gfo/Idh/MocA family oxidoreductase [Bryobacteraceae bacterium]|nr:Gfo/Idh/MocA family oxidoreductase [Bryobacteraceae bacterium]